MLTHLPDLKVMVSFLGQPTQYTIRGSDFQRANTPPSLETRDFVRHVPLDRQKSIPARSLVILETSALVSQLRCPAYLASWRRIQFEDYFFFHHPKVSSLSCTDSSKPPRETAWQGTQHQTRFWSHHFTSNTSKEYLADECPLSRNRANKQTSPKQTILLSLIQCTNPRKRKK